MEEQPPPTGNPLHEKRPPQSGQSTLKRKFDGQQEPGQKRLRTELDHSDPSRPSHGPHPAVPKREKPEALVRQDWVQALEAFRQGQETGTMQAAALMKLLGFFSRTTNGLSRLEASQQAKSQSVFFDELLPALDAEISMLVAKQVMTRLVKSLNLLVERKLGTVVQLERAHLTVCRQFIRPALTGLGEFISCSVINLLNTRLHERPEFLHADPCVAQAISRAIEVLAAVQLADLPPERIARIHKSLARLLAWRGATPLPTDALRTIYRRLLRHMVDSDTGAFSLDQLSQAFNSFEVALRNQPPLLDAGSEMLRPALALLVRRIAASDAEPVSTGAFRLLLGLRPAWTHGVLAPNDAMLKAALDILLSRLQRQVMRKGAAKQCASVAAVMFELPVASVLPLSQTSEIAVGVMDLLTRSVANPTNEVPHPQLAHLLSAMAQLMLTKESSPTQALPAQDGFASVCRKLQQLLKTVSSRLLNEAPTPPLRQAIDFLTQSLQQLGSAIGPAHAHADARALLGQIRQTLEQLGAWLAEAWQVAKEAPASISADPLDSTSVAVIDLEGRLLRRVQASTRIFRNAFPKLGPPVLMEARGSQRSEVHQPTFCRVNDQLYRFDMAGRSRTTVKDTGLRVGIPYLAAKVLSERWLRSQESQDLLQRAFLPELEFRQPESQAGFEQGYFAVALLADADAADPAAMVLAGSQAASLRTARGFGFMREDLAARLGLQPDTASTAPTMRTLDDTALQHYEWPSSTALEITMQPRKRAALAFAGTPIQDSGRLERTVAGALQEAQDSEPPDPVSVLLNGHITCARPTAIPVTGSQLWLLSDPAWAALATQGVLLGQAPYDQARLRKVDASDIRPYPLPFAPCIVDYTLTGHVSEPQKFDIGHSLQGAVIVVPQEHWPAKYADRQLLLSTEDEVLCTAWKTADLRRLARNYSHRLVLKGAIAVMRKRAQVVGVPTAWMQSSLHGCFGRPVDLVPAAQWSALGSYLSKNPPAASPRLDGEFTPSYPSSCIARPTQMPSVDTWAAIGSFYHSLPWSMRQSVAERLNDGHVLAEVLGGKDWQARLLPAVIHESTTRPQELEDQAAVLADRIARTEIALALQVASQSIVTGPANAARLHWRGSQLRLRLRLELQVEVATTAQGLRRSFENWSTYLANPLEKMRNLELLAGLRTRRFASADLGSISMQHIVRDYLAHTCQGWHLLAETELNDIMRDIPSLTRLNDKTYLAARATAQARSLLEARATEGLDPRGLVRMFENIEPGNPDLQAVLMALAIRCRMLPQDPFMQVEKARLPLLLLSLLATLVPLLHRPGNLPPAVAAWLDLVANSTPCMDFCPALLNWQAHSQDLSDRALLGLLGARHGPPRQGTVRSVDLRGCSAHAAAAICKAMLRTDPTRPVVVWMLEPDRIEWMANPVSQWIGSYEGLKLKTGPGA